MSGETKIKIMYVIGSLGDARAGTEKSLLTLIEGLDRDRFEPYLVSLQDCEYLRADDFICETTCLHLYRVLAPRMLKARRELASRMRELRIDIVHTFFLEADLVGGGAARQAGITQIVAARRNLGYAYGAKQKFLLKLSNRYPTRWLANCNAVADAISGIEGIPRGSFDVIYNGVALNHAATSDQSKTYDIIMVANLRPVKQVGTLLEAVALLKSKFPDLRIAILGEGPLRRELENLAQRFEVSRHIEFLGSRADVASLLNQARIGVLTSRSEGCSNAILEYMSAGLPVVATDVGGNRELVVEGKTGFLVPIAEPQALAERLSRLLADIELCQLMGRQGRERVEREFSVDRMIAAHADYYSKLRQSRS
ncbi:MAG: glycosyltransferase [bacterium]